MLEDEMERFTVATYNVNSIRTRLPLVLEWMEKVKPDVLCLQETKVTDDKFPVGEFEMAGYKVICRGHGGRNGVAVVLKEEPVEVQFGLDDGEEPDEDRLIKVKLPNGIYIVNTYVPQGRSPDSEMFAYKLRWFDRLKGYFERHFDRDQWLVWCGDMNVAPEPIDVHNPKRLLGHVCFRPEVWEAFERVKSWGFVDLFRKFHPDEPGHYTFFDYRVPKAVERGLGWRVDHILATEPLAQRCVDCWIDIEPRKAKRPSDHTPVVAVFEI